MKINVVNICPRCSEPSEGIFDTDKLNDKSELVCKCRVCFSFIARYTLVTEGSS